jgi:tubulin alpha
LEILFLQVGLCNRQPFVVPGSEIALTQRAAVGMMNTTAIAEPWKALVRKYDMMWAKRAFVHWYVGEGKESERVINLTRDLEEKY